MPCAAVAGGDAAGGGAWEVYNITQTHLLVNKMKRKKEVMKCPEEMEPVRTDWASSQAKDRVPVAKPARPANGKVGEKDAAVRAKAEAAAADRDKAAAR